MNKIIRVFMFVGVIILVTLSSVGVFASTGLEDDITTVGPGTIENIVEVPPVETITETESVLDEVVEFEFLGDSILVDDVILETESPYWDYEYFVEGLTYTREYVKTGSHIPHYFYEPINAENYESLPLVIWLHGLGGVDTSAESYGNHLFNKMMKNWPDSEFTTFNAYFVAPHLTYGAFRSSVWNAQKCAINIQNLIVYYVENYNVDPNRVVIMGHSLGGQGAIYMPQVLPDTFCAAAPISVYNPRVALTNSDIPVWCFQGKVGNGEDQNSVNYAYSKFKAFYGEECITAIPTSHNGAPKAVFKMDNDGDLKLDLFEWFAEQMENSIIANRHAAIENVE